MMRDAGGVERELAQLGELVDHHAAMSTRSLRVVGSPPEIEAFSMSFQRFELNALLDLRQRHVFLAVAARPVAAHLAAGVADERAMEDEDRRVERGVLRHGRPDEVAGRAHRSFREVLRCVNLCHLEHVREAQGRRTKS